jgi:hypothetical protein
MLALPLMPPKVLVTLPMLDELDDAVGDGDGEAVAVLRPV